MVVGILDAQRLQASEPHRKLTDINALLASTLAGMHTEGRPIVQRGRPLTALVDPIEVARIVENLVSNAIRHTPAGTAIWIEARTSGAGVEIVVEDEGPGVPDELKVKVFEPFSKVSLDPDHSGLGLSLVAQFAKRHGGEAWVEDRPGGGASFRVRLATDD